MTTTVAPNRTADHADNQDWPTVGGDSANTTREEPDAHSLDPTQGRRVGSDPYDDPTQGRKIGSDPYDDPTQGRTIGSDRDDDPTQGRQAGSDPYADPTQGRKIGSDPYDDPTRARVGLARSSRRDGRGGRSRK